MRHLRIVSLILVFNLFAASTQAQTGSWQAVMALPSGAYINVRTEYDFQCVFRRATDDELICVRVAPMPISRSSSEMRINRPSVREVRFDHMNHGNPLIGAAIGGTLGAVAGARSGGTASQRVAGATLAGGLFALIGAGIAWMVPIFHRKIIYRR